MTNNSENPNLVKEELYVKIWEKVVDTQMHFNEMSAKSRQLGLTFVAAALGLAAYTLAHIGADTKYYFVVVIWGHSISIHVAVLIVFAASAAVMAVKKLDVGVYHQMLRGAVHFNEDLEENHIRKILGLNKGMTQAISHFSRHQDAATKSKDGKYVYSGKDRLNAADKIKSFYRWVIGFLWLVAIITFTMTCDLPR